MEGLVADAGSFWSSMIGEQWMSWPRKDEAMLAGAQEDEATLSSLMMQEA